MNICYDTLHEQSKTRLERKEGKEKDHGFFFLNMTESSHGKSVSRLFDSTALSQLLIAAAVDLIEQSVFPQPTLYIAPVPLRPFRFGRDRVQALVESAFESLR